MISAIVFYIFMACDKIDKAFFAAGLIAPEIVLWLLVFIVAANQLLDK